MVEFEFALYGSVCVWVGGDNMSLAHGGGDLLRSLVHLSRLGAKQIPREGCTSYSNSIRRSVGMICRRKSATTTSVPLLSYNVRIRKNGIGSIQIIPNSRYAFSSLSHTSPW